MASQGESHEAVSKLIERKAHIKKVEANLEVSFTVLCGKSEFKRFTCRKHGHIARKWLGQQNPGI